MDKRCLVEFHNELEKNAFGPSAIGKTLSSVGRKIMGFTAGRKSRALTLGSKTIKSGHKIGERTGLWKLLFGQKQPIQQRAASVGKNLYSGAQTTALIGGGGLLYGGATRPRPLPQRGPHV